MNKNLTTKKLVYVALFTALVYIFSRFFQIPVVTPFGQTRFHLGNVFCLLAGILMGPGFGGLAAGLGSALFDLFDPVYFTSAPITFVTKFALAFVAGAIYRKRNELVDKKRLVIAAILGQLTYVFLYLLKTYITNKFVMGFTNEAVMAELIPKAGVSLFNALISVIIAFILAMPLLKSVKFE
ncbi:ECF transporter S component [Anaerococcus sp.]|uniref:ECF transporter S component n=1 Tax=Anaerococcus sp. TaxID=1872515 RepID=UPI002A75A609|nr:ECF transporter S component [Anaerococcus sp.]MDY2927702.1 ECF transporter S component [Anaerococcus sp.]